MSCKCGTSGGCGSDNGDIRFAQSMLAMLESELEEVKNHGPDYDCSSIFSYRHCSNRHCSGYFQGEKDSLNYVISYLNGYLNTAKEFGRYVPPAPTSEE